METYTQSLQLFAAAHESRDNPLSAAPQALQTRAAQIGSVGVPFEQCAAALRAQEARAEAVESVRWLQDTSRGCGAATLQLSARSEGRAAGDAEASADDGTGFEGLGDPMADAEAFADIDAGSEVVTDSEVDDGLGNAFNDVLSEGHSSTNFSEVADPPTDGVDEALAPDADALGSSTPLPAADLTSAATQAATVDTEPAGSAAGGSASAGEAAPDMSSAQLPPALRPFRAPLQTLARWAQSVPVDTDQEAIWWSIVAEKQAAGVTPAQQRQAAAHCDTLAVQLWRDVLTAAWSSVAAAGIFAPPAVKEMTQTVGVFALAAWQMHAQMNLALWCHAHIAAAMAQQLHSSHAQGFDAQAPVDDTQAETFGRVRSLASDLCSWSLCPCTSNLLAFTPAASGLYLLAPFSCCQVNAQAARLS